MIFITRLNQAAMLLTMAAAIISCNKNDTRFIPAPVNDVKVRMVFEHYNDNKALLFDNDFYSTSLGQHYMVGDLQYFVSNVVFHCTDGQDVMITAGDSVHYIDARVESTMKWEAGTIRFPVADIKSATFIFGLDEKANRSNRFSNPPERDMFWPDILGGGYHYMKMNLKWKNDTMQEAMPFMFHLGIGQLYSGVTHDPDSITGFVQNYFKVELPGSSFTVKNNTTVTIRIRMNVERWFDGANAFDFSAWPMGIMQEEEGMKQAIQNGRKAFDCIVVIE